MTVAVGSRLGPYEILGQIGAGGMGEVYRARDPRLERAVAIKVLPASYSSDPDRLRRFEGEAKAAGVLNHPNITAVYDIGTHEGAPYVVQELLEGETLRAALSGGRLPPRRAIYHALQIAHGLAAAHEKGIVHRDLKPDNVFLTSDGRVKILDFGLAKLMQTEQGSQITSLPTETRGTEPGVVLGTLGYMSPEQVRGKPADARSDIFSFGAILYEMLSGNRAFRGDSAADTMSAILREDPPDLSVTNQSISPGLERIVRHCLEKNPEQRFHSAHDLAFDLEALSGVSGQPAARPVAAPRRFRAGPFAAALAALVVGVAGYFIGRRAATRPLPSFHQLTFRRESIPSARFGPDGQTFVYTSGSRGQAALLAGRPGSAEGTPIPVPGALLESISRNGDLLVKLNTRFIRGFTFTGMLARVPIGGGTPRPLLEDVHWADWSPDGARFAVVRDSGGKNQLEYPIGHGVYSTAGFITSPRISPRGDLIAFLDHPVQGDDGGSVAVVDLAGKKRTLSRPYASTAGLAWANDGEHIWFAASKSGNERALRSVDLGGREHVLADLAGMLTLQDAWGGRALITRDDARLGVMGRAPGDTAERDWSWLDWTLARDLSDDGRTLLFDESGQGGGPAYSVYIRGTDGSPAVRLGEGAAMSLSKDGKWVLSIPNVPPPQQVVALPTGPGEPRVLTRDAINHHTSRWLPDGQRFVFAGNEPGHGVRLWVQSVSAGPPKPISEEGIEALGFAVSPDGRSVAATNRRGEAMLYPVDGGAPRPVPGVVKNEAVAKIGSDGRTLYVRTLGGSPPLDVHRVDLLTGRREPWKSLMPADATGVDHIYSIIPSADGSAYAYTYGRSLSQLYLVDGLE